MRRNSIRLGWLLGCAATCVLLAVGPALAAYEDENNSLKPKGSPRVSATPSSNKYSKGEVKDAVEGFFGGAASGLAEVIERIFGDYGAPDGWIRGSEGSGALLVGLRYGEGWLHLKNRGKVYVYWQGPSLGIDLGADACKVFTLVYNLRSVNDIFQRFPGVNGSAYIIGGFAMNYQRTNEFVLAPIRAGVGLRLGLNLGYLHYTREKSINPF